MSIKLYYYLYVLSLAANTAESFELLMGAPTNPLGPPVSLAGRCRSSSSSNTSSTTLSPSLSSIIYLSLEGPSHLFLIHFTLKGPLGGPISYLMGGPHNTESSIQGGPPGTPGAPQVPLGAPKGPQGPPGGPFCPGYYGGPPTEECGCWGPPLGAPWGAPGPLRAYCVYRMNEGDRLRRSQQTEGEGEGLGFRV